MLVSISGKNSVTDVCAVARAHGSNTRNASSIHSCRAPMMSSTPLAFASPRNSLISEFHRSGGPPRSVILQSDGCRVIYVRKHADAIGKTNRSRRAILRRETFRNGRSQGFGYLEAGHGENH